MIDHPLSPLHDWTLPAKLKELERPLHEVLASFIHGCSPDPATRTAATTALVLSLWQLGGRALTPQVPSMLLVHPERDGADPLDEVVRTLIHNEQENEPRVQTEGPFMHGSIALAPRAMGNAVSTRRKLGEQIPPDKLGRIWKAEAAEKTFRAAQVTAHGHGRCRPYTRAWHPDYGLLTDPDDQLILRLNDEEDRSAFCHDLLEEPEKIVLPLGIGANLFPAAKTVSISGAVSSGLWSGKHASMCLASGLPLFVLPHVAEAPLRDSGLHALRCFAMTWQGTRQLPVEAVPRLPCSDWVRRYHLALRERLSSLPIAALFPILQAIHQLEGVCGRIVGVAWRPLYSEDQAIALLQDLYHHTLRGLVIGVASHPWFGVGLMPDDKRGKAREKARRLLGRLRREGTVTKTDLLKNFHLRKHERDTLLEQLARQGLLRVDGSTVTATSYREFVEGLYASDEFPPAESRQDDVPQEVDERPRKAG